MFESISFCVKIRTSCRTLPQASSTELKQLTEVFGDRDAAIKQGLDLIRKRKEEYRSNGISFYRPWIFLITDGGPTDEWKSSANLVHEGEASKSFAFFAVGVEGANMEILKQISVRDPLKLQGLKFRELFQWLSNSMKSVSQSVPGTLVSIESPRGWSEV